LSFGPGESVRDGAETQDVEFVPLRSRGFDKRSEIKIDEANLGSLERRPQGLFAADAYNERFELYDLAER
jgi:hypothetical protein